MSDLISPWSISTVTLKPGEDVPSRKGCWCFLRIESGWAYWLGMGSPQRIELGAGDVIMTGPEANGKIRANHHSALKGHCFSADPFLLQAHLSNDEIRYLTYIAPKTKPAAVLYHPSHAVSRQFDQIASAPDNCPALDRGRRTLMMLITALRPDWPVRRLEIKVQLGTPGQRKFEIRELSNATMRLQSQTEWTAHATAASELRDVKEICRSRVQ